MALKSANHLFMANRDWRQYLSITFISDNKYLANYIDGFYPVRSSNLL